MRLQERSRAQGQSAEATHEAVVRLLRSLANYAASHAPDDFDEVMNNIASRHDARVPRADAFAARRCQPGAETDGRLESGVDLGGEVRARFTEERLAAFVAENVSRDRGATGRLAEAFNALVTSDDQRDTALLLAEERVSLSPLGSDPQFNDIWTHVVKMLMSVLGCGLRTGRVRSRAERSPGAGGRDRADHRRSAGSHRRLDLHRDDRDLRALDQQMLVDLLRLEDRPEAWASVLELALARLEQLVLVSDLRLAGEIAGALAGVATDPNSAFAPDARHGIAARDQRTAGRPPRCCRCGRSQTRTSRPSIRCARRSGPGSSRRWSRPSAPKTVVWRCVASRTC